MKSHIHRIVFFLFGIFFVAGVFAAKQPQQILGQSQFNVADINKDGSVDLSDYTILVANFLKAAPTTAPTSTPTTAPTTSPTGTPTGMDPTMSHAMMTWAPGGLNSPNTQYDKCDDGTNIVTAHNAYYVVAYDGIKYPTWHPPVVTNPITGVGKCSFGHEHGSDPQKYLYWNEMVEHFGKDMNGDGTITAMVIASDGKITAGDRAGIPFGIANQHMDQYYNLEGRDSIFVRHEDHVGHKIEIVNTESEMVGNTTHPMAQLSGTNGINIPYYQSGSETYQPTGVSCAHLHKFHQGTNTGDAVLNNLHEVIFHSKCQSVNVNNINAPSLYPNNLVLLTGMMTFGDPGGYKRFCGNDRYQLVCPDGKNANGTCKVTDPLLSKLPDAAYSNTLGRNMVDRSCLQNIDSITGNFYFTPYEIWQGDLQIKTSSGKMLAEHGRQWDVLDPVRFIDPTSPTGYSYNSEECGEGGLLYRRTISCEVSTGNYADTPWNSPKSGFKGLKRTTYFGRNHIYNAGGAEIWWTDPLGGNATTTQFTSGLKQRISSVNADIQTVQSRIQQLYGGNHFLNDRALQRRFSDGGGTVHAPN